MSDDALCAADALSSMPARRSDKSRRIRAMGDSNREGGIRSIPPIERPPRTLTGEELTATPDITTNCNPNGTSTVMFSASGVATGPYPGTFTEVGTATIGPQTVSPSGGSSLGTLLTFDAVFTIQSPTGDV